MESDQIQSPSSSLRGRNCSVINWNPKELRAYSRNRVCTLIINDSAVAVAGHCEGPHKRVEGLDRYSALQLSVPEFLPFHLTSTSIAAPSPTPDASARMLLAVAPRPFSYHALSAEGDTVQVICNGRDRMDGPAE